MVCINQREVYNLMQMQIPYDLSTFRMRNLHMTILQLGIWQMSSFKAINQWKPTINALRACLVSVVIYDLTWYLRTWPNVMTNWFMAGFLNNFFLIYEEFFCQLQDCKFEYQGHVRQNREILENCNSYFSSMFNIWHDFLWGWRNCEDNYKGTKSQVLKARGITKLHSGTQCSFAYSSMP